MIKPVTRKGSKSKPSISSPLKKNSKKNPRLNRIKAKKAPQENNRRELAIANPASLNVLLKIVLQTHSAARIESNKGKYSTRLPVKGSIPLSR